MTKEKCKIICKQCGNTFEVIPFYKNQKFCSVKCSTNNHIGKKYPQHKEKIIIICKQCGKEFGVTSSKKDTKYCSHKCRAKSLIECRLKLICKQCGKSFEVPLSQKNAKYCSQKCYGKSESGKSNHQYIDGRNNLLYCNKFNEKLKTKIRNRDNNICQLCGKTKEQEGKNLAVHHIHYDKVNCDPDLISLCLSCHSRVNGDRDYWETFFIRQLLYRNLIKIYNLNEIGIENYEC